MIKKKIRDYFNILIKILANIVLVSLLIHAIFGINKATAKDNGDFKFGELVIDSFNLLGIGTSSNPVQGEYSVIAEANQSGNTVTLTATVYTPSDYYPVIDYFYDWEESSDGINWDYYAGVNPQNKTYTPGVIYKAYVRGVVLESFNLIEEAYRSFFGRASDGEGYNHWKNKITNHTLISEYTTKFTTYNNVSASAVQPANEISGLAYAMVFSEEYLGQHWQDNTTGVNNLIISLYKFALGRTPSADDLNYWSSRYSNTTKYKFVITNTYQVPSGMITLINGICGSPEAGTYHSNRYYYSTSNRQYNYDSTSWQNRYSYYYSESEPIFPFEIEVDPNGNQVEVTSPSGGTTTNISSSTTYKQFGGSQLTVSPKDYSTIATTNYTISYNGNGGTIGTTNSLNTTSTKTDETNYTFSSWTKIPNPLFGNLSTNNTTYTFPATASNIAYISSNNNISDKIVANFTSETTTGTTEITLPNATRPGYTLNGWFTASTGGVRRGNAGDTYIPSSSETLYAHWTANAVAITIKKDNANWNENSGIKVELRQNGSTYSGTASGGTITLSGVTSGTYDIYASKSASSLNTLVDTGVDVVVTSSGTATIDYYTLTLQAGVGISVVSGGGTYLKNQTASIDATVANGYTWQGWSVISGNSPN